MVNGNDIPNNSQQFAREFLEYREAALARSRRLHLVFIPLFAVLLLAAPAAVGPDSAAGELRAVWRLSVPMVLLVYAVLRYRARFPGGVEIRCPCCGVSLRGRIKISGVSEQRCPVCKCRLLKDR